MTSQPTQSFVEHIVLLKIKSSATTQQINDMLDALRAMKSQIPGLLEVSCGTDFTITRSKGFTHALVARLANKEALKVYATHPVHEAVKKNHTIPLSEDLLAIDYEDSILPNNKSIENKELATPPIVLMGETVLRRKADIVADVRDGAFVKEGIALKAALENFRKTNTFGRAIAAPQIGVSKRFIAMNLGQGAFLIINPVITWKSEETFLLFDDCMSHPWMMSKVRRYSSITVEYLDENGKKQVFEKASKDISELLQHEIDHLEGILCADLAVDKTGLISRDLYLSTPDVFHKQVDYFIQRT